MTNATRLRTSPAPRRLSSPDELVDTDSKWAELGADSLDLVELMMQVEELFGVMIDESELAPIEIVGSSNDMLGPPVGARS
jgi:acyl carrier protein